MWSSVVAVVVRPSGYTARSWPRSWSRSRGRPPVGPMVAATGRLLPLGSLVAVAGQVAQATNGAVGVAAGLPLFKRGVLAVRLGSERALGVIDLPALPVLHRLPNRAVPGAATLDRGRSFAQLPRPFGPLQLDRAGLRAGAPFVLAHHRVVLGQQLRVGLAVGLLVLLPRAGEVAPAEPPGRTVLQAGDQAAGLLHATGRLRESLLALFASGGGMVEQPGLVGWAGVDHAGELVAVGAKVVLAHASQVQPRRGVCGGHVHLLALPVLADGGLGADDAVVVGPHDRAGAAHIQPLTSQSAPCPPRGQCRSSRARVARRVARRSPLRA